ncbi:hypothetical protein AAH979_13500 [Plantactinospora sp. ZYX-F-223]|uniref:hypothetical protein n=1 Tax=Plantactinospora sp. ZYX-F-223 TaxID=3144103 RepID=UPI0031FD7873
MDYRAEFERLVKIMTAEKGHAVVVLSQAGVWQRASEEVAAAAKSISEETTALNGAWPDGNGDKMLNSAMSDAVAIEGRSEIIATAAPWEAIRLAGDDIIPTYYFVQQQYELAKPLIAQLEAVDSLSGGFGADAGWAMGGGMLASQIEAYLRAANDRMANLGRLFGDATRAVTAAANGDIWLPDPMGTLPADTPSPALGPGGNTVGPGGNAVGPGPGAVPPGSVPNGTSEIPAQGGEATTPGGGTAPSLSGQPSTPTLPSTGAPSPGGIGPGGPTPPIGGGPGIGPGIPPMIPPIGGTGGNGRVPSANLGGARVPGVNLGGLGGGAGAASLGGGGAGAGAASIPQAAAPVGGPAQVAPSGPPPALPPATLAGTSASAGGTPPMMPPMMPPMAGAGAGVGGGGGSGAARPSGTGRGRGSQNPTPGMPALLSGKAGKGDPHAVPPRARLIRETDAPATVELIDEDLWQVGERRTEESRPARIHRH